MSNIRILIAGGGTGGHLFPALAIGEEILIRNPNTKIHYVGSIFGLESKVFPIKDVWHTLLTNTRTPKRFESAKYLSKFTTTIQNPTILL